MYKAKHEGRNNFQYYSQEMTEQAFERLHMEGGLRTAMKNREFIIHYQPQIKGRNNQVMGVEALVRWQNPSLGLVPPLKFIAIAESTGLIIELDRHVMKQAMSQIARWHRKGLFKGRVAINMSMRHLHRNEDFIAFVVDTLRETGCKPGWVEFEVTEGHIMESPEEAIKMLGRLHEIGIRIALDDFGTGYSSLAYLKSLPITKLKIDQSFVSDLPDDAEDVAICRAVIALAESLGLEILAEGVERKEQVDFLLENGCEHFQGYYYAKPMSSREVEALLSPQQAGNVTPLFPESGRP
ncbi:MAG: EAL domain-containing protein [gamma proteobacterium symbiont of Phacoides pectinatus]